MFGTLYLDKVYIQDLHGLSNKHIKIVGDGSADNNLQFSLETIDLNVFLYGSFELFDKVHISFDNTKIKLVNLHYSQVLSFETYRTDTSKWDIKSELQMKTEQMEISMDNEFCALILRLLKPHMPLMLEIFSTTLNEYMIYRINKYNLKAYY